MKALFNLIKKKYKAALHFGVYVLIVETFLALLYCKQLVDEPLPGTFTGAHDEFN